MALRGCFTRRVGKAHVWFLSIHWMGTFLTARKRRRYYALSGLVKNCWNTQSTSSPMPVQVREGATMSCHCASGLSTSTATATARRVDGRRTSATAPPAHRAHREGEIDHNPRQQQPVALLNPVRRHEHLVDERRWKRRGQHPERDPVREAFLIRSFDLTDPCHGANSTS